MCVCLCVDVFVSVCLCVFSGLVLIEMTHSEASPLVLQLKERLQQEVEELLGEDGVLLYPTHPHLAPKHHHPLFTPFNFSYTGETGAGRMDSVSNAEPGYQSEGRQFDSSAK